MGTVRDQQKLNQIMEEVKFEFKANQYDLIKKNCNHFSEAFTLSLLGKRIPSFINRASRIGFYASCFLPKMIKNSNPIPQDQDHTQNVQTRGNDAYNNQPQNLPFQMDSTNSDYTMDSSRVAFTGKGYRIADYETDNI
ncbi:UNKNOWN [Stylonychia lemnae]|uniref:PPPDE domain-containing protein n=1 Tax=Stylonychia lemnae TaxID=5949 RepID=A0A078AF34_STYLE|nr:UNKNOWN [Stylonychia lemnae]|eukprot:CDW80132.1 UNKNOWN [Stylonychia lemnae]